ncbi:hematopoietic SH2 domain-containing protein isoform X1 [Phascolarctos cinereus]|uniref:Hematopoietic SH2 domain-containing protein isoform X2 n=1 Tax=Phascolarctos cinereus TaxID=38626 RepID=A0A6P5IRW2_PHACI|nr:hematopoietic SH2 domain-containing protein isoform X2 [Phascolarctos cinereus]
MQATSLYSPLDWCGEIETSWLMRDGIPTWYHGDISREAAESLLQKKPLGCFLVRVSQSHAGYTLSYRGRDRCRHFMIKLLADGYFAIPGEKGVHSTLVELVNFYQKIPFEPYKELLTQPCGQENENNADYEEISFYSNMAVDGKIRTADSSATHMPKPSSSLPIAVSLRSVPLPWKRMTEKHKADRPNSSSQTGAKPLEQSPAPGHTQSSGKALLNDAPQKIWKNLKNLPQTGKKITEQIKSHLSDVKLSFPFSAVAGSHGESQARGIPGIMGDESATQVEDSHPKGEAQTPPSNIHADPFERAPLPKHPSHPKTQDLCLPPRKTVGTSAAMISTSEDATFTGPRRGVISGTTCQDSPRPPGHKLGSFPEEYYPPPPFAPGY